MTDAVILGTGVLSWPRSERVSDRYGCVWLMADATQEQVLGGVAGVAEPHVGQRGRLVARVIEARQSHHIGDLFHGVRPRTPEVGAEIQLGEGELFVQQEELGWSVGLRPDDGRDRLWLDLRALYDAHLQTVELRFGSCGREEADEDAE